MTLKNEQIKEISAKISDVVKDLSQSDTCALYTMILVEELADYTSQCPPIAHSLCEGIAQMILSLPSSLPIDDASHITMIINDDANLTKYTL